MSVLTLRLPETVEKELSSLTKTTGHTKSYFVNEALKAYLEDRKDYIIAASILEKIEAGEMKTNTLNDIMAKYGLED